MGYCQGMSHLAAILLMYINCDEDSFFALGQLMLSSKYNMKAFFMPSFPKLETFQNLLEKVETAIAVPYIDKYYFLDISAETQQTP